MRRGRALRRRYGHTGRPAVRGQAQLAIMDYMDHRPGEHSLASMIRGVHFRGLHLKKITSALRALEKEGLVTTRTDPVSGILVTWVRR